MAKKTKTVKTPQNKATPAKMAKPVAKLAKAKKGAKQRPDINVDDLTSKIAQKWLSYYNKAQSLKTETYNMKNRYEIEIGIQHKVLGWGYILNNTNDRLEVLFKDGIKYLISNYK